KTNSNLCGAFYLTALQIRQNMRHTNVFKYNVVHAPWMAWIFVEASHVGIYPVRATYDGNQSQIRRSRTKPALVVFLLHTDAHQITELLVGKNQIFFHQIFRDTQIAGNTVETGMLQRVTAHAVVSKGLRTTLQRCSVSQICKVLI